MATQHLGRAKYRAIRSGATIRLIAIGETRHFNDQTDFELLPFNIYPSMYAFYFIQADILMPAMRPFVYEEMIPFPLDPNSFRVQDADGFHDVPIIDIAVRGTKF